MATTYLNYGVIPVQYRTPSASTRPVDTLDVAGWLEERYGLYGMHFRVHRGDVVMPALTKAVVRAIRTVVRGGPQVPVYASAESAITTDYRRFLSSRESERVGIPGTPTLAALMGIRHRTKNPYMRPSRRRNAAHRSRRPSFIDSGLYEATTRVWVSGPGLTPAIRAMPALPSL